MLTPDKIRGKSFQTTGRGSYRSEDVDMFMNEVSASYEQMFKENGDLIKKISILAKKVEEYRADEDSLKMALLNAQKLADRIVAEAKETAANEVASVKAETDKLRADAASDANALEANARNESEAILSSAKAEAEKVTADAKAEAEKLISDATAESKEILGNINRKVTHESLVLEMIQKEASEFKAKLTAMYKEHITLINELPEIVKEQLDAEETTAEEPVVEETAVEESVAMVEEAVEEPVEEYSEEPDFDEAELVIIEPEEDDIVIIEEADEVPEEPAAAVDEPVEEKKPFKIDFSRIDFGDEDKIAPPAPTYSPIDTEDVADADADADDNQPMSFKNFFKKK